MGSHQVEPALDVSDPERFLGALWWHRLEGRLVKRMESTPSFQLDAGIKAEVIRLWTRVQHRVDQQFRALEEIVDAYYSSDPAASPLVMIKGQTAYRLIGDRSLKRWSADIDILADNPDRLTTLLEELGYTTYIEAKGYLHATLIRADIGDIDVHRFFQVSGFDGEVSLADFDPSRNPHLWSQSIGVRRHPITYRDVIESGISLSVSNRDVVIPNHSLAALIACSHTFTNAQSMVSPRIRLAELAEIKELTEAPEFDIDQFLAYVDRFDAYNPLQLTANLLKSIFGRPCVPIPGKTCQYGSRAGVMCRFYAVWVIAPWSADDLLDENSGSRMFDLVSYLGANQLLAEAKETETIYRTAVSPNPINDDRLSRAIKYTKGGEPAAIEMKTFHNERDLTIELTVDDDPSKNSHLVRIQFSETEFFKWEYYSREDKTKIREGDAKWSIDPQEGRYTIRLAVPLDRLRGQEDKEVDTIPMIAMVFRMGSDVTEIVSGTVLPIQIQRSRRLECGSRAGDRVA